MRGVLSRCPMETLASMPSRENTPDALPDDLRPAPRVASWRGYARGPRPALTLGLVGLGALLLFTHLRSVDWAAMRDVVAHMPRASLFMAGLLSAASYAVYCSFDLLARRTTGHPIDRTRVLAIGFVGHACALSLGPAGAGVRLRLYAHHGLPMHLNAALWLFNVATNWIGFAALAGAALATRWIALPAAWNAPGAPLQAVGFALLGAVAFYLVACRVARNRALVVRGVHFRLPPVAVALLQCVLSAVNWLLLGAVVHALMPGHVPYETVLLALMASALALAVVDVPAGLGVMETVFVGMLAPVAAPHDVLGALVAYRAIYFVGPLLLAAGVYAALEWDALAARRGARRGDGRAPVTARPAPGARSRRRAPGEPPPTSRRPP